MRLLLVGDTHASRSAIKKSFDVAVEYNCESLFQLGDFGFWPRFTNGQEYLKFVIDCVNAYQKPLYFLAGNHEDWNDLDIVHSMFRTDDDGFHVYDNLRISPRSNVWTWDNLNFASISGAFSIDRKFRVKNLDWFPQETPRHKDVDFLQETMNFKQIKNIDIILSHDAPVNLFEHRGLHDQVFHNEEAFESQEVIASLVKSLNPRCLIHGHWHQYYEYFYDDTKCIGLDQASGGSAPKEMILDTKERTLSTVYVDEVVTFEFF